MTSNILMFFFALRDIHCSNEYQSVMQGTISFKSLIS